MGAGDGGFEVLGKAAVSIEPSKRAFDDPAARQDLKADGIGHAPHDLDAPIAEFGERLEKLIAGIGAVGEEMAQPGEEVVDGFDNERRPIAVLHIGGVDRELWPKLGDAVIRRRSALAS